MSTVISKSKELAYEYDDTSFTESEALDRYATEKIRHPGAIVVIDGLDCGEHYTVRVYGSEKEKQTFYHKKLRALFDNLWDAVKT